MRNTDVTKSNYYEILGISPEASHAEVVRAYRQLARQFHPDHQPPERKAPSGERMKQLNEAYAILSDAESRAQYDATWRLSPRKFLQVRSRKWQILGEWADFVFWLTVIAFLITGAYLIAFEWRFVFNKPQQAHQHISQWVFAGIWFIALVITLFRLIPVRRLHD